MLLIELFAEREGFSHSTSAIVTRCYSTVIVPKNSAIYVSTVHDLSMDTTI